MIVTDHARGLIVQRVAGDVYGWRVTQLLKQ